MTKDELSQTIDKSIKEMGFARIARPALLDVFSTDKPAAFDVHDELKNFAASLNLEIQADSDEDFIVFSPISEGRSKAV